MQQSRLTSLRLLAVAVSVAATLACSTSAHAALLFFEDFESDLSQWTGKSAGAHHGQILADPLEADQAMNFTQLNSAGDIFSSGAYSSPNSKFKLSFDYLGDPTLGGSAGNLGGFIGHSFGLPGSHSWLAGTSGASSAAPILIDDGAWHHYSIEFTTAGSIHVMIEDFSGSGGVAGDAYFDNVRLESVPAPSALLLLGLGLLSLKAARRERR